MPSQSTLLLLLCRVMPLALKPLEGRALAGASVGWVSPSVETALTSGVSAAGVFACPPEEPKPSPVIPCAGGVPVVCCVAPADEGLSV